MFLLLKYILYLSLLIILRRRCPSRCRILRRGWFPPGGASRTGRVELSPDRSKDLRRGFGLFRDCQGYSRSPI